MKIAVVKELICEANQHFLIIKSEGRFWKIEVTTRMRSRGSKDIYIHTDKGELRVFKTLDAAYNTCKAIGITDVSIEG